MLQLIKKDELAERKKYKFSIRTIEKRNKKKKEKQLQRRRMAMTVVKIDDLKEVVLDGDISDSIYAT